MVNNMPYSQEYWGEDGLGPMSDDVALSNSRWKSYRNSDQYVKDTAYAERVAALEAEKKRQAAAAKAAAEAAVDEDVAMQAAVAQDAAAAKIAAAPVALPKATQNNQQQDRNSLGRQYLLKSLALGSERPDMTAMNEYARQRSQGGDLDMLNSLAAAYAGERYASNQASHLKRAMAARDPLEVSGGMLTNKGFVEDPYAARERERKSNYEVGKELLDQETKAQDRRSAANPYYTTIATPDGVISVNARDPNDVRLLLRPDGKPYLRSADSAPLQGDIAKAKEGGKLTAVQIQNDKMADSKQDAMDLQIELGLNQLASNPTGSGIGAGVDSAMGLIGKSTESSRVATALETTAGWLQNNVPRMEGPQSDRDTVLYRQMAGQIGDRTVPVENRMEALKTLQTLMNEQREIRRSRIARGEGPVYQSGSETSSEGNARPSAASAGQGYGAPPPGAVRPKVKQ
jgi:hypothetical protein